MKLVKAFNEHNNFNNAIVPLSLDVNEVFFAYHHDIDSKKFNLCEKVIKKYKNIKINYINVEKIEDYFDGDTLIDVSAKKYSSLVLYEKALKDNKTIIYFDEEEKNIKDYKKHQIITNELFKLNIEDIVTLSGGKIISTLHNPVKQKETIDLIYNTIDSTVNHYSEFISYVSKINSLLNKCDNDGKHYYLSNETLNRIINDNNYLKFKKLNLFTIDNNVLTFSNLEINKLFTVSGTFLENYIYNKLINSKKFDDVKMSVKIEFSNEQKVPVNCELDCLILKDNNLLFTSIKSNKVEPDDLNEIKVHNVMFGNEYSKPVICIYNELSENRPGIYAKAQELGIYVVEECMFESGIADTFLNIINNTYKYEHII